MKFIQAAENNKTEILEFFTKTIKLGDEIFEIGSGTGQHIVYFASNLKEVVWQPSEIEGNTLALNERIDDANLDNLRAPCLLDIRSPPVSKDLYDFVYASNVLQCISLADLHHFMSTARNFLKSDGGLVIYGPFLRNNNYVSAGDALLDKHLKMYNPEVGIKDLAIVQDVASSKNFNLCQKVYMKKNNLILMFKLF